ncbi:MAG: VWA domain-containing protein [Pirellulaceae bacterium]|nr:VWA domain-containing protein [Planctomycetales bacterium]
MFELDLAFDSPWFLLLLLLIPLLWIWSYRSLSGLGRYRRVFALLLRTAVLTLLILALANTQFLRTSDRMTVVYLLDQSASIPQRQREAMVAYVRDEVAKHRQVSKEDRASVIVFGREATIEVPPLDDDVLQTERLESADGMRVDATNLESAITLAQATFPEGSSRRIVVVTDGNENMGNATPLARKLAEDGVGIDVVAVPLSPTPEVAVERVILPPNLRKGTPFEARIVVNNLTPSTVEGDGTVKGKIKLARRFGSHVETLAEQDVELPIGKTVYPIKHEIDLPDFYEYEATFSPIDPEDDFVSQNNRATAFTHVQGQGQVLLIEDSEHRGDGGEFTYLAERLQAMNIDVTVQFTDELFTSLGELQRYDAIILGNVPRSGGDSSGALYNFSDEQIDMLVRNTQQMGCGLLMIGGPASFGAGGWANTKLEEAMPVDFQIRNLKVQAVGALVMCMHASEMAEGNYWQKVISREALKALGPQDYCGIVHWEDQVGQEGWLWGKPNGVIKVGTRREEMVGRLNQMTPGDMPEFEPAMKMALAGMNAIPEAAVKHMIIISDGDPSPPRNATLQAMKQAKIQVSTVAVGTHGPPGSTPLQNIANVTGGKYYVVTNPQALPRIYQREARRVARPLVIERDIAPQIMRQHEMLTGIDALPPIKGFVMTSVKENPLVEVLVRSNFPSDEENSTILASWNYGLGRTAVLTTDAGRRWASSWTSWENYDKLFSQVVRWAMRPTGDTGKFAVATEYKDGKMRVVVDALDKEDNFLNFLSVTGSMIGPSMDANEVRLQQTAPGRYVGEFDADKPGSYFLTLNPGLGETPIRTGVNVPYSAEFRERETNEAFLTSLVELKPKGGEAGEILGQLQSDASIAGIVNEHDTFRRSLAKAINSDYIWPYLVLISGCVFLADVFVRRVAVHFYWILPMLAAARDRVLRRERTDEPDKRMERLRSRKAQVADEIDQRRAATRFQPEPDQDVDVSVLDATVQQTTRPETKASPKLSGEPAKEEDDFTSRLLKAKREAIKDRKKDDSTDN